MKTIKDYIIYREFTVFRYKVGFTVSDNAFQKECKKKNIKEYKPLISENNGATTHWITAGNGEFLSIIGFNEKDLKRNNLPCLVDMIAHESFHAITFMLDQIGEHNCSEEMYAYHIGELAGFLMNEIIKYWKNK
jgi:hypothetical protein